MEGFKLNESVALTCFSPGSSITWLRNPCFKTYRELTRKLLIRHLAVVLELTFRVNRCSLVRATGPVFSHGSFCVVEVNGRLREVRGGTIKFFDPLNDVCFERSSRAVAESYGYIGR